MAEETKAKKVANRIAYVEPNDIYGSVNGVPLTPNYEDYCIGFNLYAIRWQLVAFCCPNLSYSGNIVLHGNAK